MSPKILRLFFLIRQNNRRKHLPAEIISEDRVNLCLDHGNLLIRSHSRVVFKQPLSGERQLNPLCRTFNELRVGLNGLAVGDYHV